MFLLQAAVRRLLAPAMAGFLILALCGCMQTTADPGSTFSKGLQRSAWKTLENYNQAVLGGRARMHADIPPSCWEPGIQRLNPVKVYAHRANLLVVQSLQNGIELGRYLSLPVSSFQPAISWFSKREQDGFVFRPALGAGVYHFSRAAALPPQRAEQAAATAR
jgi:hypothetical protein